MRIAVYIVTSMLLFFFWMGNYKATQASFTQFYIGVFVLHLVNALYMVSGIMDPYVLAITINWGLLTTAVHGIHVLKFGRRSSHRNGFTCNVAWTCLEFILAYSRGIAGYEIDRNRNLCPDMAQAVLDTQNERANATILVLGVAVVLTAVDHYIHIVDKRNNQGNKSTRVGIRPAWLGWKANEPSWRKQIYFALGIVWYIYCVITMEWFTVRDFHAYTSRFQQLSSDENSWGAGQIITVTTTLLWQLATVRKWIIDIEGRQWRIS
jgi:hypothetical protein